VNEVALETTAVKVAPAPATMIDYALDFGWLPLILKGLPFGGGTVQCKPAPLNREFLHLRAFQMGARIVFHNLNTEAV
jgi:hypothetical protein